MERASQVGDFQPYPERIFSTYHNQAFITFALISILIRRHQHPPPDNHQTFGRIRIRHYRRHLKQNPYLT